MREAAVRWRRHSKNRVRADGGKTGWRRKKVEVEGGGASDNDTLPAAVLPVVGLLAVVRQK